MQIQVSSALLRAVRMRCLARGWQEPAVSSSGAILSSQERITPFSAHFTALRELPQPSYGGMSPSSGKGNCCFPGPRGDFFPSEDTPLFRPCSNLFPVPLLSPFHRPLSSHQATFPQVLLQRWQWDRGGGQRKLPGRVAHETPAIPSSHSWSSALVSGQAALGSSGEHSALVPLPSVCAGHHQTPHVHGTRTLQLSSYSDHRDLPRPTQRVPGNSLKTACRHPCVLEAYNNLAFFFAG